MPGVKVLQVPSSCKVEWALAVTSLPAEAWIWRRVPGSFDESVVSNLVALGPFTRAHATNNLGEGPFPDSSMVFYQNAETRKHLGLFPSFGWFYFEDARASFIPKESTNNAPGEQEAIKLALPWVAKLGLQSNQFARMPGSVQLRTVQAVERRKHFNPQTGKPLEEIISRSISFIRRLDGLDFGGIGAEAGFTIEFGHDGSIIRMELVWPRLERWKIVPVCNQAQLEQQIRQCEAKIAKLQSMTIEKLLPRAKTLRIVALTPLYQGARGEEPPDFVEPFLAVESRLSDGTEEQTLHFNCRLLVEPPAP